MRKLVIGLLVGFALAACAGPRAQTPNYGTSAAAPAGPAPTGPVRQSYDAADAQREVRAIADRLTAAIVAPDMCRVVDCPAGPYQTQVLDDETVNAATDGRNIYVARGLIEFTATEGELAAVIAHEIAHGLLDHRSSKQQDALVGALLGAAVGAAVGVDATNLGANLGALSYSKTYEREADYVAMYVLARAGYGLREAYTMWQRMSTISNASGTFLDTHPAFAERLALLRATNDEIAAKLRTGQPVVPQMRR